MNFTSNKIISVEDYQFLFFVPLVAFESVFEGCPCHFLKKIRVTWWYLNTILRRNFSIDDCELRVDMRICSICLIRAVTCIGIVLNIKIGINPKRRETFQNAVDNHFLDVDLNSNKV